MKQEVFCWDFGIHASCVVVEITEGEPPRATRYAKNGLTTDTFAHYILLCVMSHDFGPKDTLHIIDPADNQRPHDGSPTAVEVIRKHFGNDLPHMPPIVMTRNRHG